MVGLRKVESAMVETRNNKATMVKTRPLTIVVSLFRNINMDLSLYFRQFSYTLLQQT
jgi:hypothetical protein